MIYNHNIYIENLLLVGYRLEPGASDPRHQRPPAATTGDRRSGASGVVRRPLTSSGEEATKPLHKNVKGREEGRNGCWREPGWNGAEAKEKKQTEHSLSMK